MCRYFVVVSFVFLCSASFLLPPAYSTVIPTSSRADHAINKVTPSLKDAFKEKNLTYGSPLFIRIFKQEEVLEVWIKSDDGYQKFRTYPICTYGYGGLGPKLKEGDGQAPEGFYFVTPSSLNPMSSYYLSFNLGYPNAYDRGHNRTGSALMVHGQCVSIGCYAMEDAGIEEIYALASSAFSNGQRFFRVHIFPFKMNQENMGRNKASEWLPFWTNLKEGYDFFIDHNNTPPDVGVKNGQYVFSLPNVT